jgi:hypothetical protein
VHPLRFDSRGHLAGSVGFDGLGELFGGQLHALAPLENDRESVEVIVLPGAVWPDDTGTARVNAAASSGANQKSV